MAEEKQKNQEEKFLENSGLEHVKEVVTIMPTMIDDSIDDREVKRDISAIIPKFETIENKEGTELTSKDAILKADGSVILATLVESGEPVLTENFALPEPIDIKARKEEQIKIKNQKKKKEKLPISKVAKRQQNIMSLVALITIIGLVAFYFLVVNAPDDEDFTPLTITIELGDKLPVRTKDYVKPGVGDTVDDLQYIKDTSNVIVEEVGEYEFSITYKGITKNGRVIIQDTTKPKLETREVKIIEGQTYNVSSFVESCRDHSGCNYAFERSEIPNEFTSPGTYVVPIIATDAYGNSVKKSANLIIESKGIVKIFEKEESFDFTTGYSVKDTYELNFAEYADDTYLFSGIQKRVLTYEDEEKYQAARKTYNGEPNYQCIDHEKQIIFTKTVSNVGNNYTKLADILNYFTQEGYVEKSA
jgi:hypothetical protein